MDRRSFLKFGAGGVGAAAIAPFAAGCAPAATPPTSLFSLGVAAGLHSASEVVLWTRADPTFDGSVSSLDWDVASDSGFGTIIDSGTVIVSAASDYTAKVLVGSLPADTSVWYRFRSGANTSTVGRARTLPAAGASPTSLKLAYASCQAYACGYYAAWRQIAAQPVDAVLFLGDYIYEAPNIQLLGRVRDEPTTIADNLTAYRERYRLYKSDADLQAAHAAHPFVIVYDDHEVANDWDSTWLTDFPQRVADAYQAWFEYQPVWPIAGNQIYRSLAWGDLGEVFMLDTRQYRGAHRPGAPLIGTRDMTSFEADPSRTILGATQKSWLLGGLSAAQSAGRTWKIIGNQSMIAPIREVDADTPAAHAADPTLPLHAGTYSNSNFDSWEGFPVERDAVLSYLETNAIENTAFVTGDYHSFWQAPLTGDYDDAARPIVANEFAAGAISSAGGAFNENAIYGSYLSTTPSFSYVDTHRNGYGLVECTPSEMKVTYYAHNAAYSTVLPSPAVQFTLAPGDPNATKTLLP